jgi:putative transposase
MFVTTYRRRVFTNPLLTFAEANMRAVCANLNAELIEFNGETDHVHPLAAYPPMLATSVLAHRLKGRTAYQVRREFTGECGRARIRSHRWSRSHFAVSCAGAPKQYIDEQARPL